ncbi:sugar ABC transporter permease [Jeotgalibacillus sp. HH7-29]|uniref:Sugar ABC transporter permease n=2 Tax=Jeotgalibacillus haloalkalitolerans TaxID=3104292 RepID=A0ABU5KIS1_9BACL|nr:sugar ABC transporter permease [Jeotgalibacillus sp. HH7-29]MDZ5711070.1 sugar ABC transporter permease [Jeotgalibacillus sp. HH7-29]
MKFQLNEKQLGYLMVAPALILVILVTLWPVAQSFYNSLFDYRLSDPSRSERFLDANMDLERYANDYFYLERDLEALESQASGDDATAIANIVSGISEFHTELLEMDGVSEQYEEVEERIASFSAIADSDLKYAEVENEWAEEYKAFLDDAEAQLEGISENAQDEQFATVASNVAGSLSSVNTAVIESNFIGLSNYGRYLTEGRMWQAMWNTLLFTIASVGAELVLGLLIALLINRVFIGRGIVRASVLIPWAIPTAVAAMMWGFLYDGQTGIVAHYFEQFGLIDDASVLLSTGAGGMFSVIFADVWKTTPYMALLLLAGLQTISGSLYEAAEVDGASKWQQFWKITLPLLKSAILVALLFRTLDAFRVFDLIWVLTGGGPANATESISIYAYITLFSQSNFGAGSTLSVIVFLSVAIISIFFIKFIGSDLFAGKQGR